MAANNTAKHRFYLLPVSFAQKTGQDIQIEYVLDIYILYYTMGGRQTLGRSEYVLPGKDALGMQPTSRLTNARVVGQFHVRMLQCHTQPIKVTSTVLTATIVYFARLRLSELCMNTNIKKLFRLSLGSH